MISITTYCIILGILLLLTLSNLFCFLCAQSSQTDYGDPIVNAIVQFIKDLVDAIVSIVLNINGPKDITIKPSTNKKTTLLHTLVDVSSAKPHQPVSPPKKPSTKIPDLATVPPKKEPSFTKKTTLFTLQPVKPVTLPDGHFVAKTPQTIPPLKPKTLSPALQIPTEQGLGITQKEIQANISNTSTTSTSTTPPPPTILCTNNDLTFPDTTNCKKYYICKYGKPVSRQCMIGTSWNCFQNRCAFLRSDVCCNSVYKTADPGKLCLIEGKKNVNPYDETRFYECVNNRIVNKVCQYGTVYNHGFYKCMKKISF